MYVYYTTMRTEACGSQRIMTCSLDALTPAHLASIAWAFAKASDELMQVTEVSHTHSVVSHPHMAAHCLRVKHAYGPHRRAHAGAGGVRAGN